MNISGNTILITGGGSGIGRALAEALHAKGNKVIVAGRRQAALDGVVAANPGMASVVLDVGDPAAIREVSARLVAEHPDLNVVIQNAGIMVAEDVAADDWALDTAEATITTNLLGPIRLTAALLPHLKGKDGATIMTVSSGLAFVPLVATPTYCATKAAIHSWSQSLRVQLAGSGVGVIELVPPGVQTELMPGHDTDPNSMPLADYIAEVMAILEANPTGEEIVVARCRPLRAAQDDAAHGAVFARLNAGFLNKAG
ncbi:SDR family oxidoreductase [Sphingomonas sp. CCH5-D11]|uniref:SDR family oxidoreductase n=1 Tax=Sphingomonas sp. CCH5-D11 TaxID=1768786 RepID=UPI000829AAF3|nr:SDR family oxidoreductase [Sphingomonas sp. CCH5-D11]